jgi:mono/diheme cytochrome c family protein
MKKLIKILLGLIVLFLVVVGGFVGMNVASWQPTYPDVEKPDIKATDDPEVIARGKYIVNALSHCGACHSPMDEYLALEPGAESTFKGGHEWHMGPLGTIRSTNITPDEATGIGSYTDAELARALRHGVGKDDRGLLFMMAVGPMSDEDLVAVMSYMRSVPAVANEIPASEIGLMGKVLFQGPMEFFQHPHTYPMPEYVAESETASAGRGKYLAEGPAGCIGCHSQYEPKDGQVEFTGTLMSGSGAPQPDETDETFEFSGPNLTMDPDTGHLTQWTTEQFAERMKAGRVHTGSPMPWETYRNMTDADIESLWLYLESLPPTNYVTGPPRREAGWKPEGS